MMATHSHHQSTTGVPTPHIRQRERSTSVKLVFQHVSALPPPDHRFSPAQFDQSQLLSPPSTGPSNHNFPVTLPFWEEASKGFWHDLRTMRWMRHPGTSFRMILIFLALWSLAELLQRPLSLPFNPITPFLLISYPLPFESGENYPRYGKGLNDLLFLAFYVIVFSFIRQTVIEFLIKPYATWLGLKGSKRQRFVEQGYAVFYWGSATLIGLTVMSKQPTWWYNTAEFWKAYPHYRMEPSVKAYYLLQLSYWIQQTLLLSLGIEKPRSDFVELVLHHCVTLWLVGWSYLTNLTMIGTAIFVSMDISDTFLAISKCINYTKFKRTSMTSFAVFLCVWTYFRHWQNLRILYSVFYDFDELVPLASRRWSPKDEVYLVGWMKWQIFGPILMLQFLNLFWYYLIWRIVFRMLWAGSLHDVREEGETDDEDAALNSKDKDE